NGRDFNTPQPASQPRSGAQLCRSPLLTAIDYLGYHNSLTIQ
ncbi:hypothetical protein A2U01_0081158, partial [Trifolium medium]|nr:hypothetical protein [Trifolium medium]